MNTTAQVVMEAFEGWFLKKYGMLPNQAIERIAELEAQLDAVQWQPIETAPKDGTLFLGFYKSHGGGIGFIKESWWGPLNGAKQGWLLRGLMIDPINKLTHWMPLPEPPQALEKDK